MPKLKIEGGNILSGTIEVSGAKNSAVALIPAALLSKTKSKICKVPKIRDIEYLLKILEVLNCTYTIEKDEILIDSTNLENAPIPEDLSEQMRASYYFMGTLLARFKHVEISFPGGCNIGARPIDLHIKGFEALGAKVEIIKNKYIIHAEDLKGTKIYLDFASVGATINLMLASTGATGKTIIENAAREPEIVNVASFLISCGCKITGAGTSRIIIEGNLTLDNGITEVFPDRIEAATYVILGALIGNNLCIKGLIKDHINAVLIKLEDAGVKYKINNDEIIISKCEKPLPTNITTQVYPGFPTDVQQPFTVLLTQAEGISTITETIYESRFLSADLLKNMGAKTESKGNILKIKGKTPLTGAELYVPDLRGGAALLLAGLIAEGTTKLDNISLILRGYEDVVEKLKNVGAKIEIIE
jgi:UDP-N-acetylglucosamine 1-carboxyvinyltransferase